MDVYLDRDAETFLLDLKRSAHLAEQRLYNDLNDALDHLEVLHATDPACRRHRYQIPDLGAMFGYVVVSSRETWTILWRYFDDHILVHHFIKAD